MNAKPCVHITKYYSRMIDIRITVLVEKYNPIAILGKCNSKQHQIPHNRR